MEWTRATAPPYPTKDLPVQPWCLKANLITIMKLTELSPRWAIGPEGTRYLNFQNPKRGDLMISIPVSGNSGWRMIGNSFSDLTIDPSIDFQYYEESGRWHGFIRNGEIINA